LILSFRTTISCGVIFDLYTALAGFSPWARSLHLRRLFRPILQSLWRFPTSLSFPAPRLSPFLYAIEFFFCTFSGILGLFLLFIRNGFLPPRTFSQEAPLFLDCVSHLGNGHAIVTLCCWTGLFFSDPPPSGLIISILL